jgi:hypothetical protein
MRCSFGIGIFRLREVKKHPKGAQEAPGKPLAFWEKGGTAVLRKTFLHKKVGASLACSDVVEATLHLSLAIFYLYGCPCHVRCGSRDGEEIIMLIFTQKNTRRL